MKRVNFILRIVGISLILCCVLSTVFIKIYTSDTKQDANLIYQKISEKLPSRTVGISGEYSASQMPILQVDNKDYACLLEVPDFAVKLPIQNNWNKSVFAKLPSRFWGSVYDDSLVIGCNNLSGQLNFCSKIDLGKKIVITDMLGTEFSYKVAKIERIKSPEFEELASDEYRLTIFEQEKLSSTYVIVRCE